MRHRLVLAVCVVVGLTCASASVSGGAAPPVAPVVTVAWLAEHLSDPALVVLDARASLRDYLTGHIPGAQPLGVENIRSSARGVPGEIFPPEVLMVVLGRLGIVPSSRVVVYSAENDPDAAFVASILKLHGLQSVSVLDGGLNRWTQEQRPVTMERRSVTETRPHLGKPGAALASIEDVRRLMKEGRAVLIDARPAEQYEAGRIPGAVSRFWKRDLAAEGTPGVGMLRAAADIEKEYEALGITKRTPVIVYCNTGHMASAVFYTLRYRLGFANAMLYDGSWVEWSMDPGRPVEKGPAQRAPLSSAQP